jgi:hypothetical protein
VGTTLPTPVAWPEVNCKGSFVAIARIISAARRSPGLMLTRRCSPAERISGEGKTSFSDTFNLFSFTI